LGDKVYQQGSNIGSFLRLSAVITVWSLPSLFERSAFRKGAIARQCINIGASATTIVSVLSVVIGLIVVLQAATSLAQFGADVFVVDLLGITVTREMGPLITAIIIAGRSGSAIAAQIATMKVTEELDALRVMALEPVRYVMVPMLFGMLISIPLLTALSILVGIGGGMIVGALSLDFTLVTVIDRLASVLGPIDLFIGIGKSFFFGAAIVFVACHFGVTAVGGSEGVGHATTRSVVVSIFSVIVLDALFSLLYLT
jgi:phospholipid/cholesterol/gamma-HCH transport system permease protein